MGGKDFQGKNPPAGWMKSFVKTSSFLFGTIWGDTLAVWKGFWAGKVVAEKCHQLIDEHGGNRCFVQKRENVREKIMHFEGRYIYICFF